METWFCSDHHFGHRNIINFKDNEGKPTRPFSTWEEMDETMIRNHNAVVNPTDRVYFLGDVAINRSQLKTLARLKGRKVLIKGNHDVFKLKDYTPYFEDIRAYKIYPKYGIICSHIPVHPHQISHRFGYNVHGHLHQNIITKHEKWTTPDERYLNVSMERINYTPITFEEVLKRLKLEKLKNGDK